MEVDRDLFDAIIRFQKTLFNMIKLHLIYLLPVLFELIVLFEDVAIGF